MNHLQPESLLDVCQRIADARQPSRASSVPGYLEEFRASLEKQLDFWQVAQREAFQASGASDDLMHEYDLAVAQIQDLLAATAQEIERLS